MRDAIVFQSFQRFYADGRKKKFKYATCGQGLITYNLKNNEKNSAGKCDGLRLANESTQAKIIRYLPAWGFPEGVEQLFGVTHHGTFEFL